jgi:hypothetical protein
MMDFLYIGNEEHVKDGLLLQDQDGNHGPKDHELAQ